MAQYKNNIKMESLNKEENKWEDHYKGMPEYNNKKMPKPLITATFKFRTREDYDNFHSLVKKYLYDGKKVFDGMQKKEIKQSWYPTPPRPSHFKYIDNE